MEIGTDQKLSKELKLKTSNENSEIRKFEQKLFGCRTFDLLGTKKRYYYLFVGEGKFGNKALEFSCHTGLSLVHKTRMSGLDESRVFFHFR